MTKELPAAHAPPVGLGAWTEQVAALHARAALALDEDVVHDLRVALRRCRSLAQSLGEIDDEDGRRRFKRLAACGRPLFVGLGGLRDAQVMLGHARTILDGDEAMPRVEDGLTQRLGEAEASARMAVAAFSPVEWTNASAGLPGRVANLLSERRLVDHLLLRRLREAHALHTIAMRTRKPEAFHTLRIGVKKLRYAVENLAPDVHETTGKLLKKLQDALGNLHDLDVLLELLGATLQPPEETARLRVMGRVLAERDAQLHAYLALVRPGDDPGRPPAWRRIHVALPQGADRMEAHTEAIHRAAVRAHGSLDASRSLEHAVAVLAHGLRAELAPLARGRARSLLRRAAACALVQGGGKAAARFARRLPLAVGFAASDRALLAILARAPRRAPGMDDKRVQQLPARDRPLVVAAGAVLHLAAALRAHGPIGVRHEDGVVVLLLRERVEDSIAFARARAPLETLLQQPVWWRSWPAP